MKRRGLQRRLWWVFSVSSCFYFHAQQKVPQSKSCLNNGKQTSLGPGLKHHLHCEPSRYGTRAAPCRDSKMPNAEERFPAALTCVQINEHAHIAAWGRRGISCPSCFQFRNSLHSRKEWRQQQARLCLQPKLSLLPLPLATQVQQPTQSWNGLGWKVPVPLFPGWILPSFLPACQGWVALCWAQSCWRCTQSDEEVLVQSQPLN